MNRVSNFAVETEFTNNILTVMRSLNNSGDRKLLETVISDYSKLLHYTQKASEDSVSLKDELEICRCFLRLQHIRYGARLGYSLPGPEHSSVKSVKKFSVLSVISEAVEYIAEHSVAGGFIRGEFFDVISVLLKAEDAEEVFIIEYDLNNKTIAAS